MSKDISIVLADRAYLECPRWHDGRLLIVSMRDRTLLRRETDGELVVHADLADHVDGHPTTW